VLNNQPDAELIKRMSEISRVMLCDYGSEFDNWAKFIAKAADRIEALTAEVERYRETLERIASADNEWEPCGWAIRSARAALQPQEKVG